MTEYDRLVKRLPEELADIFSHGAAICPYAAGAPLTWRCRGVCRECWIDFLNREVPDNAEG